MNTAGIPLNTAGAARYVAVDFLQLFLTTVGCYGMQRADLNISLTATGLVRTQPTPIDRPSIGR